VLLLLLLRASWFDVNGAATLPTRLYSVSQQTGPKCVRLIVLSIVVFLFLNCFVAAVL